MLELKPAFIAPGQWMKDKFSASSLKNLTCHMIPLALREESFVRTPKVERRTKLQLGFIAADLSDERKGLETAREQVRRLVRQGLEVNFEFVGSNPPENLAPWEQHLGFLTDGAISKWMAGLDFLVFTSLNDNTPLVIAESLASGTPILIASGTGADSMVDIGKDSLNILNATVDELKLEQSNRNLSTQASVSARRYNPTQVARNLVSLYEAAI
jgi:glycosyltransferase involved in cell wall biosynthesis